MKFQLLIKTKVLTKSLSDVVFIMLIHVKMPTIVGILTFISMLNFVLGNKIQETLFKFGIQF